MSVRLTSRQNKVALFDSVTDTAFGPVFDSDEEADSFLDWIEEHDGRDARLLSPAELEAMNLDWWNAHSDDGEFRP